VSRPFPSWNNRSTLTEIDLCHACSDHEVEDENGPDRPAFVILFLMFSGFLLNDESVPVGMEWIKYISFIRCESQTDTGVVLWLSVRLWPPAFTPDHSLYRGRYVPGSRRQ
jgi:hypothetical protein